MACFLKGQISRLPQNSHSISDCFVLNDNYQFNSNLIFRNDLFFIYIITYNLLKMAKLLFKKIKGDMYFIRDLFIFKGLLIQSVRNING